MNEKYVIGVYDLEGHFLDVFSSVNECANELNIVPALIHNVLTGDSVRGDIFQFIRRNTIDSLPSSLNTWSNGRKRNLKPVAKYYKEKLIGVYSSIEEAESKTLITKSSIQKSASGELKQTKNFTFKYI